MHKISEYDTSSLMTGLYERFDPPRAEVVSATPVSIYTRIVRALRYWYHEYVVSPGRKVLSRVDVRVWQRSGLRQDDSPAD